MTGMNVTCTTEYKNIYIKTEFIAINSTNTSLTQQKQFVNLTNCFSYLSFMTNNSLFVMLHHNFDK